MQIYEKTHMIRNYRIKYMDLEARRDAKLERLLHGGYDSGCDVEVLLEFGPGRRASIEFAREPNRSRACPWI